MELQATIQPVSRPFFGVACQLMAHPFYCNRRSAWRRIRRITGLKRWISTIIFMAHDFLLDIALAFCD